MNGERPIVVCGLGFGDEGKGTIVDALTRRLEALAVVRYNGGAQAGHNVVVPDGTWHCFAQFGAGTLAAPRVMTIISRHMLLDLEAMGVEAEVLEGKGARGVWERTIIHPDCLVITPMQKIVGRMREIVRDKAAHGSCGMGIGETSLDAERGLGLRVRDVLEGEPGRKKLHAIAEAKLTEAKDLLSASPSLELAGAFEHLRSRSDAEALFQTYRFKLGRPTIDDGRVLRQIMSCDLVIFEGAQGALLDRKGGFVPHVTKSDTTRRNALELIARAGYGRESFSLGVMRAYGHRHGAGPFVTEDESARGRFDDRRNMTNRWQGPFRVGWLDLPALRYGIRLNGGVDALAVTGLDRLSGLERVRVCTAYLTPDGRRLEVLPDDLAPEELTVLVSSCRPEWTERPGWKEDISGVRRASDLPDEVRSFIRFLEEDLETPVAVVSVGPTADHKIFL